MLIRSQTGEIVNLAFVARIFVDENPDGSASVLAAVPIPNPKGTVRHFKLAEYATIAEAQNYIDEIGILFGAVTPSLPSELTQEVSP
ncbi:MAG TPA: hypothetical protein ENK37_09325 [Oceanithermus profundus]|uniref:Uncharacterized protein n=1 Tax=Oceanithermus profundus TaxID=187137 RepID=A0A7C4V7T7_9DEIN|nr:hypothetical protein [Oceanithermus profundus]